MRKFPKSFRSFLLPLVPLLLFGFGVRPLPAQLEGQSIAGGGKVTGKIIDPDQEGNDYLISLSDTDSIVISRSLLRKKETPRPEVLHYRMTAPLSPDTIDEHRSLADWCRKNQMPAEMRLHLERIIELAPNDEAARKALGYEKRDGRWTTPKERREEAGLVVYGGESLTQQEAELARQKDETRKLVNQWKKEIRQIQTALRKGEPEAKEALRRVTAPEALAGLTDALKDDADYPQNRVLYVTAMGKIGTPAALRDLADVIIADENGEVRATAIELILQHPDAVPAAVEYFRTFLRNAGHYENFAVNRAGYALGILNAESALSDLINALVTTHVKTVVIAATPTTGTFSSDGNISFNPGTQEQTKNVRTDFNNSDVLDALRKIASNGSLDPVDFGYDIDAWKEWLIQKENLRNFRSRRDD